MSRVYPGTNTPCQRIRAAAGTGEPEEPAALVPATALKSRAPSGEKPSAEPYRDLAFLPADPTRVDKPLTADKPFTLRAASICGRDLQGRRISGDQSEFVEFSSGADRRPRFAAKHGSSVRVINRLM